MKKSLLLITTAFILSGCNENTRDINWYDALKTWITGEVPQKYLISGENSDIAIKFFQDNYIARTPTGSYLAGRFAQSNFDWEKASEFFSEVLKTDPGNAEIQRRAMVLAMGAGEYREAVDHAHRLMGAEGNGSLPQLFLTLETFKSENYAQVLTDLQKIPDDGISEFVKPLFRSWALAGQNKTDISSLNKNVVHFYHAILVADYTKNAAVLKSLALKDYSRLGLSSKSLKQIASIFEKNGLTAQAQKLLRAIPEQELKDIELTMEPVQSPAAGMARALFDMASVLYQDYPDSARLFAEMSLYLDPSQNDPRILMAHMAAQFKRYDEAISLLNKIDMSKNPGLNIKLQRQIADLLMQSGKTEQAVSILHKIISETKDVDAQIQVGDIYREKEEFDKALAEYNKAFGMLDGKVTAKHWNLLYARGITNERLKNWKAAERDLKSALALEPDHPYILNYLGYSWIDQGINLEEATHMIEKAVRLRPDDGYIVDSLGWAYFKQGKYAQAAEMLEKAVELSADDPTINDHLGDAYWQVGRKSEARYQWQRALSLRPDPDLEKKLHEKIEDGLVHVKEQASDNQANSRFFFGN